MRIGINARYLQNARGGIAHSVYYLLSNLAAVDKRNDYVLFLGSNKPIPEDIKNFGFHLEVAQMATSNQLFKIIWQHFYVPKRIKDLKIDVFHEPTFIAPFFKSCRTVITIHDLGHIFFPSFYTLRQRLYLNRLMKRSIDTADRIIAVSENTKKDILKTYKVKEEKVKVIHLAVDEAFHPITDARAERSLALRAKYGITRNYILAVSLITPHKNIVNLIRAFNILRAKQGVDQQLVVVGKRGWLSDEVFKEASASLFAQDIIFCNYVSGDDLIMFYNDADVFVCPSLFEGFGLPLLEAMACGCPVVASDCSSIPEVCAEAALLCDPLDPSLIAKAILRVLQDTTLRKSLIARGSRRANLFSWKRNAEETLKIYNSLA